MTRVLHVVEAIEAGVARHVTDVVRYVNADHIVAVPRRRIGGFTDTDALEDMRAAGADVRHVEMRPSAIDPRNVLAVGSVRRLVRDLRPSVVHGHSSIGGVAARLAAVATPARCVYMPNGVLPSRSARLIERALRPLAARVIAASDSEAQLMLEIGLARREQLVLIRNSIDVDRRDPPVCNLRELLGVAQTTLVVGCVGRLAPQKAPEVFVRACALVARELPDACFVWIGDGPQRMMVEDEIDRGRFEGRFLLVPGLLGAATVMEQFDVFALPARYEAGAPYVAMEAMRASTPVIVTDAVGVRESVEHERSGLVVPTEDPTCLAAAIARLLGDAPLRARLGRAGRARLEERFDVRFMARQLENLYASLEAQPRA